MERETASGCPFCGIVTGVGFGRVVTRDDDVIAFLPPRAAVHGHTLVASVEHYRNLADTPRLVLAAMVSTAQDLSAHYADVLGIDGMNILMASSPAAGQSVDHVHLHLIPRFESDGVDAWPKFPGWGGDLDALLEVLSL